MTEVSHRVAIGLGSNLGDRQGNIAAALRRIRAIVEIDRISPAYETDPVGYADQPQFINLACAGTTRLSPRELRHALAKIERQVGRSLRVPLGPRPIDLDLLLYDDLIVSEEDLTVPHPGLRSRAFVLSPLADIAPDWIDPVTQKSMRELARLLDGSGVRRCHNDLLARLRHDVQQSRPAVPLALDWAGVTGVKSLVELALGGGQSSRGIAIFDIYADLGPLRSGVHMSRFSQDLEDALAELTGAARASATVGSGPSASAGTSPAATLDQAALKLAMRVVESQRAQAAQVNARAQIALPRHTPASGIETNEFYTILASALATPAQQRRILGVEAEGITACPCAQGLVADWSRERLAAEGFDNGQIAKILSTIPIATHSQRSRGTLMIGCGRDVGIDAMIEIVEQSMSSETYDLLKRPDELFVVNKAHFAPRFVEDVVREMLAYAHDAFEDLPDDAFVFARQINLESIHKHDAVAESSATLGELRRELRGESGVSHTTLEQWLYPARIFTRT